MQNADNVSLVLEADRLEGSVLGRLVAPNGVPLAMNRAAAVIAVARYAGSRVRWDFGLLLLEHLSQGARFGTFTRAKTSWVCVSIATISSRDEIFA
jgi:hypothetical protein